MGAVYFARVGDFVKIGFASNPTQRMKSLLRNSRLIYPDGFDHSITKPDLVMVIPFCRMRDERNLQLLFASHWAKGEWFHWSPEFEHQMRTMQYVTHAVQLKDRTRARRAMGVGAAHIKEERWGKQTSELLRELADGAA